MFAVGGLFGGLGSGPVVSALGLRVSFAINGVIVGWQEGLTVMQEGSTAMLTIPSELGYGAQGAPQGGIPGGAILTFKVELVKVISGGVTEGGVI